MLLQRLSLPLALLLSACTVQPTSSSTGGGGSGNDDAAKPPHRSNQRELATMQSRLMREAFATVTDDGAIVIVRAGDGVELARAPSSGYGGLIDLSHDAARSDLVAYEESAEGEGAEIGRFPLILGGGAATLGLRMKLTWVDGIARVLAAPEGLIIFEESYGQRWKLAPSAGGPVPSVACPRPASVAIEDDASGRRLVGVSAPLPEDGPARKLELSIGPNGLGACQQHDIEGAPSSARLLAISDGSEILAGVAGGKVVLARLTDHELGEVVEIGFAAETLEQAIPIDGGANRIALLTSAPPRVVVLDLSVSGRKVRVIAHGHIDLPSEVRREERFFSREMAFIGGRILVATHSGIGAVDVRGSGAALTLEPAAFGGANAFASNLYRGPILPVGATD